MCIGVPLFKVCASFALWGDQNLQGQNANPALPSRHTKRWQVERLNG